MRKFILIFAASFGRITDFQLYKHYYFSTNVN